ncbi:hypothetical protein BAOM_2648 [Peribacillus asahii]|uniref:Uncharacterized protein n=1 Tax=Peribacillus asahii TaxID=228899 RepID=A0A3Q9RJR6_9BACI|nr:hypothetical protein BAOM_2648 [Peribacillus asahii]
MPFLVSFNLLHKFLLSEIQWNVLLLFKEIHIASYIGK